MSRLWAGKSSLSGSGSRLLRLQPGATLTLLEQRARLLALIQAQEPGTDNPRNSHPDRHPIMPRIASRVPDGGATKAMADAVLASGPGYEART